jgi:hypothetical protein
MRKYIGFIEEISIYIISSEMGHILSGSNESQEEQASQLKLNI